MISVKERPEGLLIYALKKHTQKKPLCTVSIYKFIWRLVEGRKWSFSYKEVSVKRNMDGLG